MVDWKRLFEPVKDGSEKLKHILVRVPKPPAPAPTEEEFVSPLQEYLTERLTTKAAIGYNSTCVNCSRHSSIDAAMLDTVQEANDPEPWLKELYGELIDTRKDLAITRIELKESKQYYTPQNRMKWAAYGAAASGSTALGLLVIRYVTEWAIANVHLPLPFLIPSILQLLQLII